MDSITEPTTQAHDDPQAEPATFRARFLAADRLLEQMMCLPEGTHIVGVDLVRTDGYGTCVRYHVESSDSRFNGPVSLTFQASDDDRGSRQVALHDVQPDPNQDARVLFRLVPVEL